MVEVYGLLFAGIVTVRVVVPSGVTTSNRVLEEVVTVVVKSLSPLVTVVLYKVYGAHTARLLFSVEQ